ncbi:MAG: YbhB/YbcL family Raf kinase inhibitor-like protein [Syntrophaceae bacterium]|nr:YbhB/YbcL family Raf kinase inhibitor-like protein [Syntrophaceae bacterium]
MANNRNHSTVEKTQDFKLKSSAFKNGGMIPSLYTSQGDDISPPLTWSGVPDETKSFVLICDDPDAPLFTWVHWVYFNIPASVTSLPKALTKKPKPKQGGIQGKNSYGNYGYDGPSPLWGTHRYFFKLYALDKMLNLPPVVKKSDVLDAMKDHVLDKAVIIGKYKKKSRV